MLFSALSSLARRALIYSAYSLRSPASSLAVVELLLLPHAVYYFLFISLFLFRAHINRIYTTGESFIIIFDFGMALGEASILNRHSTLFSVLLSHKSPNTVE